MKTTKVVIAMFLILFLVFSLSGCKKQKRSENNFSSINSICEYATLKCYYHNVAEFEDNGKTFILTYGNKKAWIEYTGIIKIGIDANKIYVNTDGNNVSISMPHAMILSISLDTDSINENWVENGLFASINAEDRTIAIAEAQTNMEESVKHNENLLKQSEDRAKHMIEKYIQSVGEKLGKKYSITWNYVD